MMNTIHLPAKSTKVMTDDIPWKIANAIIPADQADVVKITAFLKKHISLDGAYENFQPEQLTDSDWKQFNHLCELSDLPPLMKGGVLIDINLSEWGHYKNAFEKYKLKWMPLPFSNTVLKTVADAHRENLTNAIIKNDVVVYDNLTHLPLHGPTNLTALKNTYMHRNTFIEYVAKFDLKVLEDNEVVSKNSLLADNGMSDLKKVPVEAQQDKAILNWLVANGYKPKELPAEVCGKSGMRKKCGDVLLTSSLFSSKSIFHTAWQRLRDKGEIVNVK
ncbi:MAG: hypothetical protein ABL880_05080 [Methylotenera sp.]